ncbi:MAG TPA: protein kinase [Kofleriaceae bacterium]|nr:protein kinase [Kofleriaceae bacterium]
MRDPDDERPTDSHAVVDDVDEFPGDGETVTTVDVHLAPGTNVGGYLIESELGFGGMGVVYAATHPVIGKRAAIKVLKPELSKTPAAVERFMMEARAVNQIGHPNIVDIFAFGALPDGRSYYVMDLLTGESLRRRLKRGPLHVSEAVSILDEVASALIAAHDKGIIHRDLKPDNIFMVTVPGRWPESKLLDWGLLKLTSAQSAVSNSKYRTLAGSVMGTPVYMSPEQARASDQVDLRTDIYALGVMAYELLSGVVPFKKGSSIDTLLAHQEEPVPSLAEKCPALPIELVQLIEAMLSKEPDGRPTLAAVRAVIKRLRGTKIPTMTAAGLEITPLPSQTPTRPSQPAKDPFVEPPTMMQPLGYHKKLDQPFIEPPTLMQPLGYHKRVDQPFIEPPTAEQARPRQHDRPAFADRVTAERPAEFDPKAAFAMDGANILDDVRASSGELPVPDSAGFTAPRMPTPIPGSLPLPAPPSTMQRFDAQPNPGESLPYQSMNVTPTTTLAGHSMPPQSSRPPMYARPGSIPPQNQPRMPTPLPGSIPPMYQQPMSHMNPMGSMPPQLQVRPSHSEQGPAEASSGKRLLVIIIAALIASGIGIAIALLAK